MPHLHLLKWIIIILFSVPRLDEIAAGNYIKVPQKPTIISALGAVYKADSNDLRLIHESWGRGLSDIVIAKNSVLKLYDDADGKSRPLPCLITVLFLFIRLTGMHLDWNGTFLVRNRSVPGIFHRITQAVKRIMIRIVVYLDDFLC